MKGWKRGIEFSTIAKVPNAEGLKLTSGYFRDIPIAIICAEGAMVVSDCLRGSYLESA